MSDTADRTNWPPTAAPRAPRGWWAKLTARLPPVYSILLALIMVGAVVVGWAVLPGEDERIEALERDGQTSRAFQLLEARYLRGDHRQRTLFSLRRFYDYYGDNRKSLAILELLAQTNPRDLYIQRQLAQFYRLYQDMPNQIRALKAQLAIRYSEPVCQRLIGLLHQSNDFDGEQATLIGCHASGYRRPEDLVRLAAFYAADGHLDQTAQILGAVDDRRWLRGSHERLMLFDALMTAKLPQDALRRAVRWYRGQPDPDLALEMISRLVASGHNDLGLQLARRVGQPGDAVTLAVGEILVDQVQYEAARAFLAGWLAQTGPMSTETALRFVSAAVDAEDPALAMRGAERQGLDHFQGGDLAPLAEALIGAGLVGDFDKVRAQMTPDTIASNGLVAAAVELRGGQLDAARNLLTTTVVDPTEERRVALKSHLLALAGHPAATTRLLREPAHTEVQLAPPVVAISPGETLSRRVTSPVEISKRFRRLHRKRGPARAPAVAPPAAKASPLPALGPVLPSPSGSP